MRAGRPLLPQNTWSGVCLALFLVGVGLIVFGICATPSASPPPPGPASAASAPSSPGPAAAPMSRSEPVRLAIPSLGVSAPVMPLGLEADGTVEVPPIERDAPAGWYNGSPTPGEAGASVVLGHSTVGRFGKGVLFDAGRLEPGARVDVTRADGSTAEFTVREVREYTKADFPADKVYQGSGAPELRLVTCGGPRDADHGYRDNIVVYAALTGHRADR